MSERVCADLEKIPAALAKTGFILEHSVAKLFEKSGWATIGGRYYADDVDGRARELDLVAYRADETKELSVITAILVSCKKDQDMTWAFMTKDKPAIDPNFDWDPVHYWTDVQPLATYLASSSWKEKYLNSAGKVYGESLRADKNIFAFQQISSSKVTAQNDKAIFDSIVTLMKALDHEIESVPSRAKARKRLYTFWLLSVVDAPMVDVNYSDKEPVAIEVGRITHLARYMVRKRDLSALVHFVRSDKLHDFVTAMTKLAIAGAKHMQSLIATAYEEIRTNQNVRDHFAKQLKPRLIWRINSAFKRGGKPSVNVDELSLGFDEGKLTLNIDIYDDKELEILNSDKKLHQEIAKILSEVARYEREFTFESDFPF
jgi:hypothetical protein